MKHVYKIDRNNTKCTTREEYCKVLAEIVTGTRVNWLIGAGFSSSILSPLGNNESVFETLENTVYTNEQEGKKNILKAYLYWSYFINSIYPIVAEDIVSNSVFYDYLQFASALYKISSRRNSAVYSKRTNIFTTNYDPILELAFDKSAKILYNDGFEGRIFPYFSTDNYSKKYYRETIFSNQETEIPVVDILKLHGSVTWKKHDEQIEYQYYHDAIKNFCSRYNGLFDVKKREQLYYLTNPFKLTLEKVEELELQNILERIPIIEKSSDDKWTYPVDETHQLVDEILRSGLIESDRVSEYSSFYDEYIKSFLIVNPTKAKFKDTLMNKNYYELLRVFSNELEKENSTLIAFGFSFDDEHILDLIKRSMINPNLKIIVFCYKEGSIENYERKFADAKNNSVSYVCFGNEADATDEQLFALEDLVKLLEQLA